MQTKKQQLELDIEKQTGSKLGKEYIKVVFYIVQHKVSKVFPLEKEKEKVLREPPSPFLPPDSRTVFPGRPWWLSGKESAYQCRSHRVDPWDLRRSHPLQGNQAGAPQLLSLRS